MTKEEEEEQKFFAEQLKHQQEQNKMATKEETEKETKRDSVAGYSGSKYEGVKFERPEGASKEAVVSDCGATEPTTEFGGDGVTPLAEWDEKYVEVRKKQAEKDKKKREQAAEDAGVIQTITAKTSTEKKHG